MIVVAVTVAISCMVFTSFVSLFLLLCFVFFFCCSFLGWLHLINSIVLQLVTISLLQFLFFCSFLVCLPCWHTTAAAASSSSTCLNSKQLSSNLKLMWLLFSYSHVLPPPNELSEQQQSTVTISSSLLLLFIHMLSYYSTRNYLQMSVDEVSILLLLLLRLFDMSEHMQACRAALCVSVFIAALSNNNHTQTHTLLLQTKETRKLHYLLLLYQRTIKYFLFTLCCCCLLLFASFSIAKDMMINKSKTEKPYKRDWL